MEKRKFMAILFALILLISSVPLSATAFETPPVIPEATLETVVIDGVSYQVNKKSEIAKVLSFDGSKTQVQLKTLVECDGLSYPVTEIGNSAFLDCSNLASLVIGEGVTTVGSSAFLGCVSLSEVVLPSTLTTLSKKAFSGCTSLSSVSIPRGVNCLKDSTFENCTALQSIYVFTQLLTVEGKAFSGCTGLQTVWYEADAQARSSMFVTATENEMFLQAAWNYYYCSENADGLYHTFDSQTGTVCDLCGFEKSDDEGDDEEGGTTPDGGGGDDDSGELNLPGDINLDKKVDSDDVIYLLNYTKFGEQLFPIPDGFDCDVNRDTKVDNDDVFYLLYYIVFGTDLFPLD